jgi:hypothetical protein
MYMKRRQYVAAAGATVTAVIAGCLGDDGGNDPESVVVNFYESGENVGNAQEAIDELGGFLHTESPILEIYETAAANENVTDGEGIDPQSAETIETEILGEDLSTEQLNEEFSIQSSFEVSDELLQDLAEENARVRADVTYQEGGDETSEFLTVTEDSDWVIFGSELQSAGGGGSNTTNDGY